MTEYKLADGTTLTADDIVRESAEYENGIWDGHLERIHVGPAAVSDELLVAVTVKFPTSMVSATNGPKHSPFPGSAFSLDSLR